MISRESFQEWLSGVPSGAFLFVDDDGSTLMAMKFTEDGNVLYGGAIPVGSFESSQARQAVHAVRTTQES